MTDDRRTDRAEGALLGLAAGDAASFPAMYHRQIALPHRRRLLWTQALAGDAQLVNKFPLPFTLSGDATLMNFGPTDDAEQAALAGAVLLNCGDDPSIDELFDSWLALVAPQRDALWGSVSDRSAILNAQLGLRAPATGNDNPHHYDDSATARSVAVGIRWSHQPEIAASIARRFASITHAEVGLDGAAAFAIAIAALLDGADIADAITLARAEIGTESWISRRWDVAERVLAESGGAFEAIPRWSDEIVNAEYSFGNIVAETLPLAMILAREAGSIPVGLGLAALLPKQADTLPAMVGALLGAALGAGALPASWSASVERLYGFCVPSTRGAVLRDLAAELLTAGAGS